MASGVRVFTLDMHHPCLDFYRFDLQRYWCKKYDYQLVTGTKIRKYAALMAARLGLFRR